MKVIAGALKGRKLVAPSGSTTRPTTGRVRENLFNILENHISFSNLRVMDLFAGSGALGIEALSRGADFCLFIDKEPGALAALRENLDTFSLTQRSRIIRRDITGIGRVGDLEKFDLAFADPPYGQNFAVKIASSLHEGGWLKPGALLALEEANNAMPESFDLFERIDMRIYGRTAIALFEYSA